VEVQKTRERAGGGYNCLEEAGAVDRRNWRASRS